MSCNDSCTIMLETLDATHRQTSCWGFLSFPNINWRGKNLGRIFSELGSWVEMVNMHVACEFICEFFSSCFRVRECSRLPKGLFSWFCLWLTVFLPLAYMLYLHAWAIDEMIVISAQGGKWISHLEYTTHYRIALVYFARAMFNNPLSFFSVLYFDFTAVNKYCIEWSYSATSIQRNLNQRNKAWHLRFSIQEELRLRRIKEERNWKIAVTIAQNWILSNF